MCVEEPAATSPVEAGLKAGLMALDTAVASGNVAAVRTAAANLATRATEATRAEAAPMPWAEAEVASARAATATITDTAPEEPWVSG